MLVKPNVQHSSCLKTATKLLHPSLHANTQNLIFLEAQPLQYLFI